MSATRSPTGASSGRRMTPRDARRPGLPYAWRLALIPALLLSACSGEPERAREDMDFAGAGVLIISVDTLRADRLGCYGYDRGTSPNLDDFADEAILFEDMYSNSPKTASSHMSLFTSLLPTVHKVRNQSARLGLESPQLASNRLTIAQVLNRNGYWNAAVAGGANLNPEMGFKRGFRNRFESGLADVSQLVERALQRFDSAQASGQPPFLFLHTYQVHGPYLPPREFEERFAPNPSPTVGARVAKYRDLPFHRQWSIMNRGPGGDETLAYWYQKEQFDEEDTAYLSDLYDGEIAYTDQQLGELFDALRERELFDSLIIVLVSDHGEEFREHGDFEHDQLYTEHLKVPGIVRLPGGHLGGTRVEGMTSLIDVMPTVLELLEIEGPPIMQGESLVGSMLSGRTSDLPVVAERVMFPADYKASIRSQDSNVVFHATESRLEAYDLEADQAETNDVIETAPFVKGASTRLKQSLSQAFHQREILDSEDAGGTITVDEEQMAALIAVGYFDEGGEYTVPEGTPLDSWPEGADEGQRQDG